MYNENKKGGCTMKKRLAVLYGGKSGEHDVSLQSAFSVLTHISYEKYEVVPVFLDLENKWFEGEMLHDKPKKVEELSNVEKMNYILPFTLKGKVDVCFPVIHGTYGEDGSIQGLLEIMGMPYVGCQVLASATGMDKIAMKKMFEAEKLPQCEYVFYTRNQIVSKMEDVTKEIEDKVGYPCFVKPANLGSSVGITKAKNKEECQAALLKAAEFDRRVIVEENVVGREVEIGVLGNEELQCSAVGEIQLLCDFYDYEAKYQNQEVTKLTIPAPLPDHVVKEMEEVSKKAFRVLDGSGLSRVDFFYNEEKDQLYINEINTMPGFTAYSMYPMLFQEKGIAYKDLIQKLIDLAYEQFENKKKAKIKE